MKSHHSAYPIKKIYLSPTPTTTMAIFSSFRHVIKRHEFVTWIPLLKRAYSSVACDVKFYFDDLSTAELTIDPDLLQDYIETRENVSSTGKIMGFELTASDIWNQMVGWNFMPTIDEWMSTVSDEDAPQLSEDIEICSAAINKLIGLLSHQPGIENVYRDRWNCPLKFIKYVCTQTHLRAVHEQKQELLESQQNDNTKKHTVANIFFQQHCRLSIHDPCKSPPIEYDLVLRSSNGCMWRLSSMWYTNCCPDLTLHLRLGFQASAGRQVLLECKNQFEEWKRNGFQGEIFKLLQPHTLPSNGLPIGGSSNGMLVCPPGGPPVGSAH